MSPRLLALLLYCKQVNQSIGVYTTGATVWETFWLDELGHDL